MIGLIRSGIQQTTTEVSDTSDVFLASGLTTDTWTCDVTPYDGTDYGTSSSDSMVVETSCDDSGLGVYAAFETGTKCPVAYWDMETTTSSGDIDDLIDNVDLAINGSPTSGVAGIQGTTYSINTCSDFFSLYYRLSSSTSRRSIKIHIHMGKIRCERRRWRWCCTHC